MENSTDFRAETVAEEYAELVGKLKTFKAYLDFESKKGYPSIEIGLCIEMLGLEKKEK